jgi:AcrR family transcriptional regulator
MDEKKQYHHGDLKNLLIGKVLEAVKKNNLENFSTREAARVLSVSPAAPYNHFEDKQSLILASILFCKNEFTNYLKNKILTNELKENKKLSIIGKYYLQYAYDNPEIFIFMFSQTLTNKDRINNYDEFHKLFLNAIEESFSLEDLRKRVSINSAVNAAWSIVHGIACLIASKTISDEEVDGYINGKLFDEISAIWAVGVSKPPIYRL